jgi:hypothetical protein
MNSVFKDLNFWNLFIFLEREDIEADTVEKQLEILSTDFLSKSGQNRYSHDGENIQEEYSIVFFDIDLGSDYLLQLEYIPRPEGSAKYLHLKDKKNNTLFASRDRYGIKPFYYTVENNKLLFVCWRKIIIYLSH